MKQQLMALGLSITCCSVVQADNVYPNSAPVSAESEYFMAASHCYAPSTNGKPAFNGDKFSRWGGSVNLYASMFLECTFPIKHDRNITSVVLMVDSFNTELRDTCRLKIRYDGSQRFYGAMGLVPYIYNSQHYRIDNVGTFPRVQGGHQLIGGFIQCTTAVPNPASSSAHTRFTAIRVDYD